MKSLLALEAVWKSFKSLFLFQEENKDKRTFHSVSKYCTKDRLTKRKRWMCFFNWRHIEFILLYVDCRTKNVCSHAHTCPSTLRLKSWFQTFYLHVVSSSRSNIHHRNIPHGAQTHASVSPKILLVFLSGVSQIKKKILRTVNMIRHRGVNN